MHKPLIFNSTPLIYLTRVSLLHFFKDIYEEKFTTPSVFYEVVDEGKKKGAPEAVLLEDRFKEKIIRIYKPRDKEFVKALIRVAAEAKGHPLHAAEAEILAVTKEMNSVAITDDRIARSVARLFEINLHGTGYVLGKIYITGKISKEELMQKVKEMRKQGWYVSAQDYLDIIQYLEKL